MAIPDLPTVAEARHAQRGQPKPETRKRVKGRKFRAEAIVKQQVRARCAVRDGDCRLYWIPGFVCGGESEWAHLEEKRRARTRGQPPTVRHTTAGSVIFCTTHHQDYDTHRLQVQRLTPAGADGPLSFQLGPLFFTESHCLLWPVTYVPLVDA